MLEIQFIEVKYKSKVAKLENYDNFIKKKINRVHEMMVHLEN